MLSSDGSTLTSQAVSPYLDFLADQLMGLISGYESHLAFSGEVIDLDSNSNEVQKTPSGQGLDSSLTLPEFYQTPTTSSGGQSGVSRDCLRANQGGLLYCKTQKKFLASLSCPRRRCARA